MFNNNKRFPSPCEHSVVSNANDDDDRVELLNWIEMNVMVVALEVELATHQFEGSLELLLF